MSTYDFCKFSKTLHHNLIRFIELIELTYNREGSFYLVVKTFFTSEQPKRYSFLIGGHVRTFMALSISSVFDNIY